MQHNQVQERKTRTVEQHPPATRRAIRSGVNCRKMAATLIGEIGIQIDLAVAEHRVAYGAMVDQAFALKGLSQWW